MQAAVIVGQIKADVVTVCSLVKNQCALLHRVVLLFSLQAFALAAGIVRQAGFRLSPIGLCHVVRDKGRVVVGNGAGGVEQHSPQVLFDIADFRCVLPQTVKDKADMFAGQLHVLGFHQLGRVVVPGDTDCLSGGADGFQHQVYDFVKLFTVNAPVLNEIGILDVLQNDFPINPYSLILSCPFPFRRRSRCLALHRGRGRGWDRNGMGTLSICNYFFFFDKSVLCTSLFNCVGFSDAGLSDVGFSNTGLSDVGFSNTGFSNTGCS